MSPDLEKPAIGGNQSGPLRAVLLGGEQADLNPKVNFRLEPGGEEITFTGRVAQTLLLLVERGGARRHLRRGFALPVGAADQSLRIHAARTWGPNRHRAGERGRRADRALFSA